MRILHLLSCRGWSSDAYWAARVARELQRRGHEVSLGGKRGTEVAVLERVRAEGVSRIVTFDFAGGAHPAADVRDVRRLAGMLAATDVVHVHRGKEHWLAAMASRLSPRRPPVVRTRHIAQAVRPHAGNRWLYRRATALVVTVTDAIRRQYLASGLVDPDRLATLPGGVDADAYRVDPADASLRRRLGGEPGVPLVGMVAGFRVMKGHVVVIEAAARLAARGLRARFVLIGRGGLEGTIRQALEKAGLTREFTLAGFVDDLPAAMATLDLALYVPLESDGMSRVVFEYLAAARPLVAARVGVVPEALVDGEHALLVPAGEPEPLADAIARALGDADRRTRLGQAGRRLIEERYSGARLAAALEARYTRLRSA